MKAVPAVTLAISALLLAGCSGGPGSSPEAQPPRTTPTASSPATAAAYEDPWLDRLVPVGGGRSLHATCWGHGSPAVINLHGRIMPYDDASWAHSPDQRAAIAPHTTYCEYERTNVGTSSKEAGPIPLTQAAHDLDALLDAIGIKDPVVLLAGSYGGLLGTLFAGTYPDRLAGIVLRDPELAAPPELPGCPDTDLDHYVPGKFRLRPSSWKDNAERSDQFPAYALTRRVLDRIPRVPGVLFAATKDNYPPGTRVKPFMRCLRAMQRDLADRFEPGRMVVLDAGHGLEGYGDRVNATVLRIVRRAARHQCPFNHDPVVWRGGNCAGELRVGRNTSRAFSPHLTFALPEEGWTNVKDFLGNYVLMPPGGDLEGINAGTSDSIYVAASVYALGRRCSYDGQMGKGPPGVGRTAGDIARELATRPGVIGSAPEPVEVGGLTGYVVDLRIDPAWKRSCFFNDAPTVPTLGGLPPTELSHSLQPGFRLRYYLLDHDGGTLAVEVQDAGRHDLYRYAEIVSSFRFG